MYITALSLHAPAITTESERWRNGREKEALPLGRAMEAMACKEEESWVTFEDDEEALSLSDLPVVDRGEEGTCCGGNSGDDDAEPAKSPEAEDFEFRTCSGGLHLQSAELDMCAADEVFFQGQILPLRPSVSSDSGLFPASRGPSRCGSRSESMDRYSSATGSMGFESSRSLSGRSSSSISRSQSTHSSNSASSCTNDAPARLSVSNTFYAHPSPKPHVCSRRNGTSLARKSTSSAGSGWGLLRLGLVKTPEMDLDGLRHRSRTTTVHNHVVNNTDPRRVGSEDGGRAEKAAPMPGNVHRSNSNKVVDTRSNGSHKEEKPEKKPSRLSLGSRFRCSCSPGDVVDPTCSRIVIPGETGRESARPTPSSSLKRRQERVCHSRTFEWLAELSVTKPPVA